MWGFYCTNKSILKNKFTKRKLTHVFRYPVVIKKIKKKNIRIIRTDVNKYDIDVP